MAASLSSHIGERILFREEHLHLPTPCRQGTSFCKLEISSRSCWLIILRDLGSGFRPASLASLGVSQFSQFSQFCTATHTFRGLHVFCLPQLRTEPPVDQEIPEIFGFLGLLPKHCMNHALDHWIQLLQDVALLFLAEIIADPSDPS